MRYVKFLIFVLLFGVISSTVAFTQQQTVERKNGLVFSLNSLFNVPSIYNDDSFDYNHYSGLEFGYLFHLGGRIGSTFSVELGYNGSKYGVKTEGVDMTIIDSVYIGSISFGGLYRINMGGLAIALGGGLKYPLLGKKSTKFSSGDTYTTFGEKIEDGMDMTPYAKALLEYSFFVDTRTAITLGANAVYNFSYGDNPYKATPEGFYFGAQIGLRFGPRL